MGKTTTLLDLRKAFSSIDDLRMILSIASLNTTITLLLTNAFLRIVPEALNCMQIVLHGSHNTYTFLLNPLL